MSTKKETTPSNSKSIGFALGATNYKLMLVGVAIILIGFALMIGGGSDDPNFYNPEIFSFRRITLAPIVVLAGFVFEIYAIMKKPVENELD